MPPPCPSPMPPSALPPVMVTPLMVTVPPERSLFMKNTPDALLPLIDSADGPGPLMVTASSMTSSPLVSVIVPLTPVRSMVSPGFALASASRRLPPPESLVFETVSVAAPAAVAKDATAPAAMPVARTAPEPRAASLRPRWPAARRVARLPVTSGASELNGLLLLGVVNGGNLQQPAAEAVDREPDQPRGSLYFASMIFSMAAMIE